jgi:hypothetical protein
MSDVFISYARQETGRARQLAHALEQAGFSVWWDHQVLAGESWAKTIERQIDEAQCVIVLWSPTSVASAWVADEAAYALESNKLIPVVFDDVKVPLGFRVLQNIELKDWDGQSTHPAFQRLVAAISSRLNSK